MQDTETKPSATEAAGYVAGVGVGMTRSALGGKPISSSIIVLAAAVLIAGGGHIQHADTRLFVMVVGCGVGLLGLLGWVVSSREK
jgi:hypothetical protein